MKLVKVFFCIASIIVLVSCNNKEVKEEIADLNWSQKTSNTQPEVNSSHACEVLTDMLELHEQIMSNDPILLQNMVDEMTNNPNFNFENYLLTVLNVDQALIQKISAYDETKIQLMRYELEHPESDGEVYAAFLAGSCSDAKSTVHDIAYNSRIECGGWGPVIAVMNSAACIAFGWIGRCVRAYRQWQEQARSGCLS